MFTIVPSKISVEEMPPVLMLTAPAVVEKYEDEKEAIPFAAVDASSIVMVVPVPDELEIVRTPVSPSIDVTPLLPLEHEPKLGVVPPRRH